MINLSLCSGRHQMPKQVKGSIFSTEVDPLAPNKLEQEAMIQLEPYANKQINIYVTGLTVALIAALNATKRLNIEVILYHFDRNSGTYFPQEVL